MATFGGSNIVKNGLVLHLDAANQKSYRSGGTTWFDLSGQNNNGTLTNGPTFNSSNGGSIVFDGVDDYVDCGTGLSSSNITISMWFKFSNLLNKIFITKGNWDNNQASYSLIYYSNAVRFDTFSSDVSYSTATYNFIPVLNVWYNIIVTANSNNSTYSFYINGASILISSSSYTIPRSGNYSVFIGKNTNNSYKYTGNIANTVLYNRALSASEVLQNYNATKGRFNL